MGKEGSKATYFQLFWDVTDHMLATVNNAVMYISKLLRE